MEKCSGTEMQWDRDGWGESCEVSCRYCSGAPVSELNNLVVIDPVSL